MGSDNMVYLDKHLKKYPLMQVQDILKLHLQGILGPTHLIKDIDRLKQALKDDTVMSYTTRCKKNIVTLQLLNAICQWHRNGKHKFKKF